jgi:ubiquitin carboxyl-terminal hydrolase 34
MWQVCGYIPQTLLSQGQDFTEISAQLSTSFFIETFIHAKEKVNDHYVYTGRVVLVT